MYIHQYTYRCILNMMKRSWFSFILFFHFLIYLWIYFFESGVEGYSSFWMGDSPLKKNNFYLNQETSPHCREHVHTGTLYTGIDYSILKISSLFNKRENKNLKLEKKKQYFNKVKSYKYNRYTVAKRCYEENNCFKNWSKSLKVNWKSPFFSKVAVRETLQVFFQHFWRSFQMSKLKNVYS